MAGAGARAGTDHLCEPYARSVTGLRARMVSPNFMLLGSDSNTLPSEARWSSPSRTTHLRSASQEVLDCHDGLFAAKAKSGEPFFLRLSKSLTSL
jgi:hypothetical protein